MGLTPATLLGALVNRLRAWTGVLWRWEASLKGVQFEGRCEFLGRPLVRVARDAHLIIGDDVRVWSSVRANPLGLAQPSALVAMAPGARLVIGPRVGLSGTTLCAAAAIEIGEGTIFGAGAMVVDNDFYLAADQADWGDDREAARATARPVKIGRGVFIGTRAMVFKGITIGDRAVVGAGAVVTRDVPAHHIAAGNPACILKPKDDQSRA